jgi:hypothetical protein
MIVSTFCLLCSVAVILGQSHNGWLMMFIFLSLVFHSPSGNADTHPGIPICMIKPSVELYSWVVLHKEFSYCTLTKWYIVDGHFVTQWILGTILVHMHWDYIYMGKDRYHFQSYAPSFAVISRNICNPSVLMDFAMPHVCSVRCMLLARWILNFALCSEVLYLIHET